MTDLSSLPTSASALRTPVARSLVPPRPELTWKWFLLGAVVFLGAGIGAGAGGHWPYAVALLAIGGLVLAVRPWSRLTRRDYRIASDGATVTVREARAGDPRTMALSRVDSVQVQPHTRGQWTLAPADPRHRADQDVDGTQILWYGAERDERYPEHNLIERWVLRGFTDWRSLQAELTGEVHRHRIDHPRT
jgi:hypothetical protein